MPGEIFKSVGQKWQCYLCNIKEDVFYVDGFSRDMAPDGWSQVTYHHQTHDICKGCLYRWAQYREALTEYYQADTLYWQAYEKAEGLAQKAWEDSYAATNPPPQKPSIKDFK